MLGDPAKHCVPNWEEPCEDEGLLSRTTRNVKDVACWKDCYRPKTFRNDTKTWTLNP